MGLDINVQQGQYNDIHPTVEFIPFGKPGQVRIGDCNTIGANVRIFVGPGGIKIGDWNTIHTGTTIIGNGPFEMGHNCWVGQNAYLDHTGTLLIRNGVTIGVGTHIWTHIARGEQLEGWRYNVDERVELQDDVWLVGGGSYVAPNVTMGRRSVALALSAVTHDVPPDTAVAGVPAEEVADLVLRTPLDLNAKMALMETWVREFCADRKYPFTVQASNISLNNGTHVITILKDSYLPTTGIGVSSTFFHLDSKHYTKRLTPLEREFITFLKANRARFIPA